MRTSFNSMRPSDTHIYELVNLPSLVQIMACRLVGTKPLSEPMLEYCLFDPKVKIGIFSLKEYI